MSELDTATAAFVDAVRHGRPSLVDVALEVGASAASQGVPLAEALDRVAAAYGARDPEFVTVRAVVDAWMGSAAQFAIDASCHDPLTALGTVPHLRSRLDDVYRQAAHRDWEVAMTHALVVVELGRRRPGYAPGAALEDALAALEVSHALCTVFPAHDALARVASDRFVALTAREDADAVGVALLSKVLAETLSDQPEPRIWVEWLPESVDGLAWLLSRLAAPS